MTPPSFSPSCTASTYETQHAEIQVNLARPLFDPETTPVLATIRVIPKDEQQLHSLQVCLMCGVRFQERWHGKVLATDDDWPCSEKNTNVQTIWKSNCLDLLMLPNNSTLQRPKPIVLQSSSLKNDEEEAKPEAVVTPECDMTTYTIRVDVPKHLPPTIKLSSCRYFYNLVMRIQHNDEGESSSVEWIHVPVRILMTQSNAQENDNSDSSSEPSLTGMAHVLPIALAATEWNQPRGRLRVRHEESSQHATTVMRVTDPDSDAVVGVLTLILKELHAGDAFWIQLDVPVSTDESNGNNAWLRVHQISAAVQGEEIAIRAYDGQRTRAASLLLATAIQQGSCCSYSLRLQLPWDAPVSVQTAHVEVHLRCLIDILVMVQGAYKNLRLEVPLSVLHRRPQKEGVDNSDDAMRNCLYGNEETPTMKKSDIRSDLKCLAFQLADQCDLLPKAPPTQETAVP